MEQQSPHPLKSVLNNLQYDLAYLSRFSGRPCYITFEYKYYVLSLGIAKLKSLEGTHHAASEKEQITNLLSQYHHAFKTIV